jgi:hypothetical protein
MHSPEAVATAVAKSRHHLDVEAQLAALRREADGRRNTMRELIAGDRERNGAAITALERDVDKLNGAMRPLRSAIVTLRAEHGARIAAALAPMRRELAGQLLDVLAEDKVLRETLNRTELLIERAGGSVHRVPPPSVTAVEQCRRIVGSGRG